MHASPEPLSPKALNDQAGSSSVLKSGPGCYPDWCNFATSESAATLCKASSLICPKYTQSPESPISSEVTEVAGECAPGRPAFLISRCVVCFRGLRVLGGGPSL